MSDPRHTRDASHDGGAAEARDAKPRRGRWVAPRITDHGSLRHMVRGTTGILGDKGGPLGRRN